MKEQKKLSKVIKLDEKKVKKIQKTQKRKAVEEERAEKIRKIKEFRFTKKHFVVLGIIILGILIYFLLSNYHIYGLVLNKNITMDDVTVIETTYTNNQIYEYKDCVLVFEKDSLKAYDYSGNVIWNKKLEEIYTPQITTKGDFIQITNNDTGYIYILNSQYETGRIKINGNILSASINKKGTSVVEYSTSGLKTVIGVYDKNGKEIYAIKLNSNTVSTCELSDDGRYLAYSYADISGISVVTKIDIVDLKALSKDETYITTINAKNNELVYKMYWEGKKLNVLLNNTVITYNAKNNEKLEFDNSNINAINMDICDKKIAYISTNGESSNYLLNIKTFPLKNVGEAQISDLPKYFIYKEGLVYVCMQDKINIFNKWGWNIKNFNSDMIITKPVIFNEGKCVAISLSNKIVIFKI